MEDVIVARTLHVLGVVLWVGGVAFVTLVLLPEIRRLEEPGQRVMLFERLENRFAWQARATTLIVGLSGLYMTAESDLWIRFSSAHYWWMHAMALIWVLFTVMLFVAEPLFLHGWFLRTAEENPERVFRLIERLHRLLLSVSLITVVGAVAGSHGLTF